MDKPIQIAILVGILLIVLIVVLTIIYKKVNKKVLNAMYENIYNVLKEVQDNIDGDSKIIRANARTHDYYFETLNKKYYIKIVYNPGNHEICVNNALKWQLRKSFNDDRMYFVEGIEPLMRMEISASNKETKKLYIVYPNARSLLKYINECEMVFVNPNTDVYGTNIMTFNDFKDKFKDFNF